jgi:hypothetical protein
MAAAATLSTGPSRDFESSRADILAFLQALPWRIATVEVRLWTAAGLPHGSRRWVPDEATDFGKLADELAQFVAADGVSATIHVRERNRS